MEIVDLGPEHYGSYFHCLEEWSQDIQEAGEHKACWYHKYKEKGLRVKLAIDDDGEVCGMIQYLPVEVSFIEGHDLYFILCIWVHGHKEGMGNRQGRGAGTALLEAAEQDARALGAKGMAAWGLWLPIWMRASWFRKHGYQKAERNSLQMLVWKPFTDDAQTPHWIRQRKPVPTIPGKVAVTAFVHGWCPVQNTNFERTKRACDQLGENVILQTIDTSERDNFLEWGIADGIFVDGKAMAWGPPLAYEKILRILTKKLKRLSLES